MFDPGCDYVRRTIAGKEQALNRQIVRFAATARKDDLVRRAAKKTRDLTARSLQGSFSRRARPMSA